MSARKHTLASFDRNPVDLRPTALNPVALNRRDFLRRGLSLAAVIPTGAWLVGCGRRDGAERAAKSAAGTARVGNNGGNSVGVSEALTTLQTTTADGALPAIAALIERGLSHDELRAALVELWAGVDGDIHGGLALHGMLAIERELPPKQRLLALFRAVDLGVAHRLAWKPMPPRRPMDKKLLGLSLSDLTSYTRAAFDGLHADRVRMGVRALHQRWGQEAVSAELFRMAARDDGFGGHGAHLIVAALDLLRTVRWHAADAVLDQVASRLQPPGTWQAPPSKMAMAAFARQQRRVAEAGGRWLRGVRQMTHSRALRKAARTARGDELEAQVRAALDRGVHPDALWDGLALAAADMTLMDPKPSGTGLHSLLLIAALRQAARRSPTPQAQLLVLLGAAWRLPALRPGRSAAAAAAVTVTTASSEMQPLHLKGARKRRADAIRKAAGQGGAPALAVRDGIRDVLLRKAIIDPHWLELPVATTRLAAVAAPPFQGEILAATATSTPDANSPDWLRLAQAQRLIAELRR